MVSPLLACHWRSNVTARLVKRKASSLSIPSGVSPLWASLSLQAHQREDSSNPRREENNSGRRMNPPRDREHPISFPILCTHSTSLPSLLSFPWNLLLCGLAYEPPQRRDHRRESDRHTRQDSSLFSPVSCLVSLLSVG